MLLVDPVPKELKSALRLQSKKGGEILSPVEAPERHLFYSENPKFFHQGYNRTKSQKRREDPSTHLGRITYQHVVAADGSGKGP